MADTNETQSNSTSACGGPPADLVPNITDTRAVPPLLAQGVRMRSFPVAASWSKLKGLCDTYLNNPAPNAPKWRPLTAMMYIQVLHYDRLISEPYANLGYIQQNELVFNIPIISMTKPDSPRLGFFSAYLVVDNPQSLVVGREVFGYPKSFGSFDITPHTISVTDWLVPHQGPDVAMGEHPLLDIPSYHLGPSQPPNGGAGNLWPFGPVHDLFRRADAPETSADNQDAPPFELDETAWRLVFDTQNMPIIQPTYSMQALKQFDSMQVLTPGPQKAAYQARVQAKTEILNQTGGGLMTAAPLTIHRYDPLDLIDTFGISTKRNGTVRVWAPFWVDTDFRLFDAELLTCHC